MLLEDRSYIFSTHTKKCTRSTKKFIFFIEYQLMHARIVTVKTHARAHTHTHNYFISENTGQFISAKFKQFARNWGF